MSETARAGAGEYTSDVLEWTLPDEFTEDLSGAAFERSVDEGWGDGLPVIAPTRERVRRMLDAAGRPGEEIVAVLPPKNGVATVAKVATNAVMAGCRPQDMPAVIAAVEAVAIPEYELYGTNTTTNPCAPLVIVNGPARARLGLNASWGMFGPCFRPNATIGRALNLTLINIAGRVPGEVSKGTYKMPGAFTLCAAEWEEESPWEPLHVSRGFATADDVVTTLSVAGTTNIVDSDSHTGMDLAYTLAHTMSIYGTNSWIFYGQGESALMLSPPHAHLLAEAFDTRRELQEFFHETCRIPLQHFPEFRIERMRRRGLHVIDERGVWISNRPDQFMVFVAGGPGGYHSCFLPGFGDSYATSRPF